VDPRFSQLGDYVKNPATFKDPGDQSLWKAGQRVRSFSMNCAVGNTNNPDTTLSGNGNPGPWRLYRKESDLSGPPGPSDLWVLLDEHPDGINDGFFSFAMPPSPAATTWIDGPATYHNNACAFSFADGHAEIHKWLHSGVFGSVNWNTEQAPEPIRNQWNNIANNPDVLWFAHHTTAPTAQAPPGTYYP
jgi:prepilin-type processing-associated H-X9-DG protein